MAVTLLVIAFVAGLTGAPHVNSQESALTESAQLWQTSCGSRYDCQEGDKLKKLNDVAIEPEFDLPWSDGPTIAVNTVLPANAQEVVGFGGAFTEAASIVFALLPQETQERVVTMYWGSGDSGIGYTLGRVHINSCDFCPNSYALDNIPGDVNLTHFDISHDEEHMIPLMKAAQAQQPDLKIIATPWSPPAWMKTVHDNQGCTGDTAGMCGSAPASATSQCLPQSLYDTWAEYFVKFIQSYIAAGVTSIWAVTPQNEPEFNAHWEACVYTAEQEAEFVANYLGPKLRSAFPPPTSIKLFVHDLYKTNLFSRVTNILDWNNKAADEFIDGVAIHWYTGDLFDEVASVHTAFSQKLIISTEATYILWGQWAGADPKVGDWRKGLGYAHDIMGDLKAGASGWIDWNLLLDSQGGPNHVNNFCDAAMMVNRETKELYIHPQYYFMGHFSKFILPKYRRLDTHAEGNGYPAAPGHFPFTNKYRGATENYGVCDGSDLLDAVSFSSPSGTTVVTVVLNCGDGDMDFKLRIAHGNADVRAIRAHIPGRAIQTYIYSSPHMLNSFSTRSNSASKASTVTMSTTNSFATNSISTSSISTTSSSNIGTSEVGHFAIYVLGACAILFLIILVAIIANTIFASARNPVISDGSGTSNSGGSGASSSDDDESRSSLHSCSRE